MHAVIDIILVRVRIAHKYWVAGVYTLDYKVTDQCENVGTGSLTIYVNNTVQYIIHWKKVESATFIELGFSCIGCWF